MTNVCGQKAYMHHITSPIAVGKISPHIFFLYATTPPPTARRINGNGTIFHIRSNGFPRQDSDAQSRQSLVIRRTNTERHREQTNTIPTPMAAAIIPAEIMPTLFFLFFKINASTIGAIKRTFGGYKISATAKAPTAHHISCSPSS